MPGGGEQIFVENIHTVPVDSAHGTGQAQHLSLGYYIVYEDGRPADVYRVALAAARHKQPKKNLYTETQRINKSKKTRAIGQIGGTGPDFDLFLTFTCFVTFVFISCC